MNDALDKVRKEVEALLPTKEQREEYGVVYEVLLDVLKIIDKNKRRRGINMIDINKLIEIVDSSREVICAGTDSYGEPDYIDIINADTFVELLKKEAKRYGF
jgi:hypothetical protein